MKKAGKLANGQEYTILDFVLVLNHKAEDLKTLSEEFLLIGGFEKKVWDSTNSIYKKYIEHQILERIPLAKATAHSNYSIIPISASWPASNQPKHLVLHGNIIDESRFAQSYPITANFPIDFSVCCNDPTSKFGEKETILFSSLGNWQLSPKFTTEFDDLQAIFMFRVSVPAFFEMHSHIESNHCSPLPPAWVHVWDGAIEWHALQPGYKWQDRLAPLALGEGADIGAKPTVEVGDIFLTHANESKMEDVFPFLQKTPLFGASLMPMDMDYMHFNGYFGVPVSCLHLSKESVSGKNAIVRWYNWDAIWGMPTNNVPFTDIDTGRVIVPEKYVKCPSSVKNETWCYMDEDDADRFEPWHVQHKAYAEITGKSANGEKKGSNCLPFFHFEPRRFTPAAKKYNKTVIDQIKRSSVSPVDAENEFGCISELDQLFGSLVQNAATPSQGSEGLFRRAVNIVSGNSDSSSEAQVKPSFFGVKLYTAMGWAPEDPYLREPLEEFYRKSELLQIPLLNHCTPAGYYSHDRRHYLDLLEGDERVCPGSVDEKENGWKKKFSRSVPSPSHKTFQPTLKKEEHWWENREEERLWWFIQQYVSPRAWASVVGNHKKLKLCLAHFGDSDHLTKDSWGTRKKREPHETLRGWFDPKKHLRIKFEGGKIVKEETHQFLYELLELIDESNRVFVDLSYVILSEQNAEKFQEIFTWARKNKPILLERILWGTDWPLIAKQDPVTSATGGNMLHRYAKAFRDAIPKMPSDFFLRAAFLNPLQYLDVKTIHEKMLTCHISSGFGWCQEYPAEIFDADYKKDKAQIFYKSMKAISVKSNG